MFSQSNEDEIIADIFAIIGVGDKTFVEFGCGDGRQNNTIALLHQGWSGTWLDPHRKRVMSARERWKDYPVDIIRRIVTPSNVNKIVPDDLDFLSIDIDGNDYAVWQAIMAKPRVVCIEYDAVNGSSLQAMIFLVVAKNMDLQGVLRLTLTPSSCIASRENGTSDGHHWSRRRILSKVAFGKGLYRSRRLS